MSDWHLSRETYAEASIFFESIYTELKKIKDDEELCPNLLIISGDLVHQVSNDFDQVGEVIEEIISICNIDRHHVFFVPGNHEVDWERIQADKTNYYLYKALINYWKENPSESNKLPDDLQHIIAPGFEKFKIFADSFNLKLPSYSSLPGFYYMDVEPAGYRVRLCGLNTSLVAGPLDSAKIDDELKDRIGISSLLAKMIDPCKTRIPIVVSHYPLSWLHQEDQEKLSTYLGIKKAIFLHGHLHKSEFTQQGFFGGDKFLSFGCGAIIASEVSSGCQFHLIRFGCNPIAADWCQWTWNGAHRWQRTIFYDFPNDIWRHWCATFNEPDIKQPSGSQMQSDISKKAINDYSSEAEEPSEILKDQIQDAQDKAEKAQSPDLKIRTIGVELGKLDVNALMARNLAFYASHELDNMEISEYLFNLALKKAPTDAGIINDYAIFSHVELKNFTKAQKLFEKAIELESCNATILGNYANLLAIYLRDFVSADRFYQRAIAEQPTNAIILTNYANYFENYMNDRKKAEELYLEALASEPDNTYTISKYANFLELTNKDYEEAGKQYKKAFKIDPADANILGNLAAFYSRSSQPELAEEFFLKAFKMNNKHIINLGNYAIFQNRMHRYEEAEGIYERAIELAPDDAILLGNYAILKLVFRKDIEEAEYWYNKSIDKNPYQASSISNLALLMHEHKQDYPSAERLYRRALELDPDNAVTNGNYAYYLLTSNNLIDAERYALLAWSLNGLAETRLLADLILYFGVMYLLVGKSDLPALGKFKALLNTDYKGKIGSLNELTKKIIPTLNDDDSNLYLALCNVINDESKINELDKCPRWLEVEPVPLENPWPKVSE